MDSGPPGMSVGEWGDFAHNYALQLAQAPKSAPYQYGLCERAVWSLKTALRAILADGRVRHSQKIQTQAAMARNHGPHTATGIPPPLAMAGRCHSLAGRAAAWSRDPESMAPEAAQAGEMRSIRNDRTAVMRGDSNRALRTCIGQNLPGRRKLFYTVGESAQISIRGIWVGGYRIIGRAPCNLIMYKGEKIAYRHNEKPDWPEWGLLIQWMSMTKQIA